MKSIRVKECKCFNSKKRPLLLVFENADPLGKDSYVMFKAGDDLRQDILTLNIFNFMNKLWMAENLNLNMSIYGCIATGDEIGMLEFVLKSETLAKIQSKGDVNRA